MDTQPYGKPGYAASRRRAFCTDGSEFVVTKLDRLGRSLEHLIELSKLVQARGVDLVVLDQGIDTSTVVLICAPGRSRKRRRLVAGALCDEQRLIATGHWPDR